MTYHFRTPETVMTPLLNVRPSSAGRRKGRRGRARLYRWTSAETAPATAAATSATDADRTAMLNAVLIAGGIMAVKLSMLGLLIHSL